MLLKQKVSNKLSANFHSQSPEKVRCHRTPQEQRTSPEKRKMLEAIMNLSHRRTMNRRIDRDGTGIHRNAMANGKIKTRTVLLIFNLKGKYYNEGSKPKWSKVKKI